MASSSDSSTATDDEIRRLYERYQAAESDAERHEIALEMGNSTNAVTPTSTTPSKTNSDQHSV